MRWSGVGNKLLRYGIVSRRPSVRLSLVVCRLGGGGRVIAACVDLDFVVGRRLGWVVVWGGPSVLVGLADARNVRRLRAAGMPVFDETAQLTA